MLKNAAIKSLAVLMMLAMFSLTLFAQDGREKIKFAKGKSSVTLKRIVSGDAGAITFSLTAKKGQVIKFTVDGNPDLGISLCETGSQDFILEAEPGKSNEYKVAKSGEHFITVVNLSNTKANFTLQLTIK